MPPKVIIGFITYGESTAKYLPYFLPSLKKQTFKNCEILAWDNTEVEENENSDYFKKKHSDIKLVWAGENTGFARGYNILIRQAIKRGAKYFLAVNPDMILGEDILERLVAAMESNDRIGALAPKILFWDFERNFKTNIVDSCGIFIASEHRFSDLRQGEPDNPAFRQEEVFGFTGAAVLLRLEALRDVAYRAGEREEYFDELMLMYKEDADLSYRLRLAGWKIIFTPSAVCWHHRTASPKGESDLKIAFNRRRKSRQVKRWSFLHHWILLLKISRLPFSRRVRLATAWYQFKSMVFVVLFEQYLLKELVNLWQLRGEIKKRREQLKVRVDIGEIEKFMARNTKKTNI